MKHVCQWWCVGNQWQVTRDMVGPGRVRVMQWPLPPLSVTVCHSDQPPVQPSAASCSVDLALSRNQQRASRCRAVCRRLGLSASTVRQVVVAFAHIHDHCLPVPLVVVPGTAATHCLAAVAWSCIAGTADRGFDFSSPTTSTSRWLSRRRLSEEAMMAATADPRLGVPSPACPLVTVSSLSTQRSAYPPNPFPSVQRAQSSPERLGLSHSQENSQCVNLHMRISSATQLPLSHYGPRGLKKASVNTVFATSSEGLSRICRTKFDGVVV